MYFPELQERAERSRPVRRARGAAEARDTVTRTSKAITSQEGSMSWPELRTPRGEGRRMRGASVASENVGMAGATAASATEGIVRESPSAVCRQASGRLLGLDWRQVERLRHHSRRSARQATCCPSHGAREEARPPIATLRACRSPLPQESVRASEAPRSRLAVGKHETDARVARDDDGDSRFATASS